jgi:serine protease Do
MPKTIRASALAAVLAFSLSFTIGTVASSPIETQTALEQGFSSVVKNTAPAVVSISSSRLIQPAQIREGAPITEEMLRQFMSGGPRERREHNLGSGVIVSTDGYVVTNSHLVEGASEVLVTLSDNRELPGKVIGKDTGTDIAVLKIAAVQLPSLRFGDSSKVQVGDLALAMGNAFGLGRTVTMGIVSATGRGGLGIEDYEDFIQTDASINPGNSGGALTNARGELIGVNTAILSPSGVNLGIGFAIPSNMVRTVMDEIVKTGKVTRGYMGVSLQDVTPNIAAAMKLGEKRGALVSDVDPDGPGVKAGLHEGDVIVEVNGKAVRDTRELRLAIGSMAPGAKVDMRVERNGKPMNVPLTLTEAPPKELAEVVEPEAERENTDELRLGIAITDLTPSVRQRLNISEKALGVLVVGIQDGGVADEAGLREGDIIQEVNRQPVQSASMFHSEVLKSKEQHEPLLLRVRRAGESTFVAVK